MFVCLCRITSVSMALLLWPCAGLAQDTDFDRSAIDVLRMNVGYPYNSIPGPGELDQYKIIGGAIFYVRNVSNGPITRLPFLLNRLMTVIAIARCSPMDAPVAARQDGPVTTSVDAIASEVAG